MKFDRLYNLVFKQYTTKRTKDGISLRCNNKEIGSIGFDLDVNASKSPLVVDRLLNGKSSPLYRINHVYVLEEYKNKGFGQFLYLSALAMHPNNWFYNSQAWPDAHKALKSMKNKGLIDLVVIYNNDVSRDIGPHVKKITQNGIDFVSTFNLNS